MVKLSVLPPTSSILSEVRMPLRLNSTDCHLRLYVYWDDKRAGRRMPARADIAPEQIRALLPNLMLIDVLEDDFRYRLVGTRIVEDMGRNLTAASAGSYVEPAPYAAAVIDTYRRVRDLGVPVFTGGVYVSPRGVKHWVSRLLLPLGADHMHTNMILSSRVAHYRHRRLAEPNWLSEARGSMARTVDVPSLAQLTEICREWERGVAAFLAA